MPEVATSKLIIGELKGTAHPAGVMRGILGSRTQARAIQEWKQFYAQVACENVKKLVESGVISRAQYRKVVKAVAAGLHEEFVRVK